MTNFNKLVQAESTGRPVYSQTFPCEPSTAEVGRKIVQEVLGVWELDNLVDRAALIVTELIANAVNHTPCREIRLIVGRPTPSQVRVGVVDREPSCLPALSQAEADHESGRGLLLIDAVADRWGCDLRGSGRRPWGKEVWAELRSNADG